MKIEVYNTENGFAVEINGSSALKRLISLWHSCIYLRSTFICRVTWRCASTISEHIQSRQKFIKSCSLFFFLSLSLPSTSHVRIYLFKTVRMPELLFVASGFFVCLFSVSLSKYQKGNTKTKRIIEEAALDSVCVFFCSKCEKHIIPTTSRKKSDSVCLFVCEQSTARIKVTVHVLKVLFEKLSSLPHEAAAAHREASVCLETVSNENFRLERAFADVRSTWRFCYAIRTMCVCVQCTD